MSRFLRPRSIRLEAATVCQLKCPSCPTASGEIGRTLRSGFLKFENFKKIVDENPWVAEIELSNWGEILLNPDLVKIMAYAWKRSVNLRAENGVNLNTAPDEVLEGLVRYRFHSMNCSIDGASVETYPIYRRKGDFEKVILHVRKINAFKRKYGSEFPRLKWQFVAFGHNEHEIAKARQMAKELGMSFYVKLSWDGLYGESFSPVKDKETVRREVGLEAATREEYQERYHKVYIRQVCTQLWKHPQVNFDGRVLGCCVNYWADFGNAFTEGLAPSLNSEKLEYARAMLMGKGKPSRHSLHGLLDLQGHAGGKRLGPAPGSGRRTPADAASKLDGKEIRGQAQSAGPPFRRRKLQASSLISAAQSNKNGSTIIARSR